MRPAHFLFITSAILLMIVIASFFLPLTSRPAAEAHPEYQSLERTLVGSEATLWWGYAMGLTIITLLGLSVVLGMSRKGQLSQLGRLLVGGFICFGLIFTALILSYAHYAEGTDRGLFFGLPPPTAWMLYGTWLFPILMVLAFIHYFDCYFSDEDEQKFDALIRANPPDDEVDP